MQITDLKNKHLDKECVILSCGLSLKEYPTEMVFNLCKNKIVICIKESIIEYKNICNYFIANETRHRKYNFHEKTIKIFQKKPNKNIEYNKYDIILNEDISNFSKEKMLLNKKNFDDYSFDKNLKRPWGPGILYETAFYLVNYMGIKKVYTLGWDLIDISKSFKIVHYFDNIKNTNDNYKNSSTWGDRNYLQEMTLVQKNIPYLYEYFKKKNTDIFVVGQKSFVNKIIPRIYLDNMQISDLKNIHLDNMQIPNLKNKHLDKECVILSCGPSLKEYPKGMVFNLCKNKIVICIKESIIEYKNICDYFIANEIRHRKYNFHQKTIKIFQKKTNKNIEYNKYDIILNEDISNFSKEKMLLKKKNFDDYSFDKNLKRPWGPGILYETAFYLVNYMGIKKVYTLGWDLIDITKSFKIVHYFDNIKNRNDDYKNSLTWENRNFLEEMTLVQNNIPYLYEYFKKKNTDIFVVGQKSFVNKIIPRIHLYH
jgi:hypothetical protein